MKRNKPKIAVRPLPKWVMTSYAKLWKKFDSKPFYHTEAARILRRTTSVLLSFLRKAGWLTIQLDQHDSRKRVYILKNPKRAIEEMKR